MNRSTNVMWKVPAVGLATVLAMGFAPGFAGANAAPSPTTKAAGTPLSTGDYHGKGTVKAGGTKKKMHVDDAYVVVDSGAGRGSIDALLAKKKAHVDMQLAFEGGTVVHGHIHGTGLDVRVKSGKINGGTTFTETSKLVLKTTGGKVVVTLKLKRD